MVCYKVLGLTQKLQNKGTLNNAQILHCLVGLVVFFFCWEADWIVVTSDTNKQRGQWDIRSGIWVMVPGETSTIQNSSFVPNIEIWYHTSKSKGHISIFPWERTEFNVICDQSFHCSPAFIGLCLRCTFLVSLTVFSQICGYSATLEIEFMRSSNFPFCKMRVMLVMQNNHHGKWRRSAG